LNAATGVVTSLRTGKSALSSAIFATDAAATIRLPQANNHADTTSGTGR
jgi:hypothetical protein